jgi:hypothetical protein
MITIKPTTNPIWVIATNGEDIYIPLVVNVGSEFATGQPTVEEYEDRESFLIRLDELGVEYGEGDYVAEEVILVPNWDSFNFTLFTDPAFIAYGLGAQGVNPYLVPALVERYGQIAKLGLQGSGFANYFIAFCNSLQVSLEHRGTWANLAGSFNLPGDFVQLIRGEN